MRQSKVKCGINNFIIWFQNQVSLRSYKIDLKNYRKLRNTF